jgi:SAM-dependent methyltransferase
MLIMIAKLKKIYKSWTPWYREDFIHFKSLSNKNDFILDNNYPCVKDKFMNSGEVGSGGHYFFQDLYVAREIFLNNPIKHIDVGSRIDGFIAHLSVFREVEVIDIRPQNSLIKNIVFMQADITSDVQFKDYCDSISCLHSIEHFGLGRYGDEIDPDGHIKGFESISEILKPNGIFYFSVPMGNPNRIEFNAHRIFSLEYLIRWVEDKYKIEKFSYIDDSNQLFEDVKLNDQLITESCGCTHGCGIFILRKK